MILAIDPGPEKSHFLLYDPEHAAIVNRWEQENREAEDPNRWPEIPLARSTPIVVEWIAPFMLRVGHEVWKTHEACVRFDLKFGPVHRLPRTDVKLHFFGSPRGNDADVRAILVERFGPSRETAIGTKKHPGPLYGLMSHYWAALAVAIVYAETKQTQTNPDQREKGRACDKRRKTHQN